MVTILFIVIGVLLIFMGLNIKGKVIGSFAFPMIIGGLISFVLAYIMWRNRKEIYEWKTYYSS